VTGSARDEAKQHEMRLETAHMRSATDEVVYKDFRNVLEFSIGDVRDYDAVLAAVRRTDVVFHAAALKQVPSCEYAPIEAVKTNVDGAANLVAGILNEQSRVKIAIAVSAKKACKPANVMRMTRPLQKR